MLCISLTILYEHNNFVILHYFWVGLMESNLSVIIINIPNLLSDFKNSKFHWSMCKRGFRICDVHASSLSYLRNCASLTIPHGNTRPSVKAVQLLDQSIYTLHLWTHGQSWGRGRGQPFWPQWLVEGEIRNERMELEVKVWLLNGFHNHFRQIFG